MTFNEVFVNINPYYNYFLFNDEYIQLCLLRILYTKMIKELLDIS